MIIVLASQCHNNDVCSSSEDNYIIHHSAFSYIDLLPASASKDDVLVLEEAKQGGDTADTEELEDLEQSLQVRTARIVMIFTMMMIVMI